jgi:hypothetical protein
MKETISALYKVHHVLNDAYEVTTDEHVRGILKSQMRDIIDSINVIYEELERHNA